MGEQGGKQARASRVRLARRQAIDLSDLSRFSTHQLVAPMRDRYQRDATLAEYAIGQLVADLERINSAFREAHDRVAFTSVEGRVKREDRFLAKLLRYCRELADTEAISDSTLENAYTRIKDLAGVRFSCPYFDEVVPAVNDVVRPELAPLGYATDFRGDSELQDRNYLDDGDGFGYRSYHFYIRVPTVTDIYGAITPCLCEVQARTELQHVWANKSHDLLYTSDSSRPRPSEQIVDLMKLISDNLRTVDGYLVDIRRRVRGEDS